MYGSIQVITKTFNQLIEDLQQFGVSRVYTDCSGKHKFKTVKLAFAHNPKIISIWCINCNSLTELVKFFDSGNEMIYWSHTSGLVISPFAQVGIETNQVVPNIKWTTMSLENLINLKIIGYDISNYISSVGFFENSISSCKNKFDRKTLTSNIGCQDLLDIGKFIIDFDCIKQYDDILNVSNDEFELNDYPNLLSDPYLLCDSYSLVSQVNNPVKNIIVFTGVFKTIINNKIILCIPDESVAHKFKKIVDFCIGQCKSKYKSESIQSCIIDSNYLKPEEKYLAQNSKINEYINENNLVVSFNFPSNRDSIKVLKNSSLHNKFQKISDVSAYLSDSPHVILFCRLGIAKGKKKLSVYDHFDLMFI